MLSFDHPLSERVRSLIRIEHLFNRFNHAAEGEDKWSHHIALNALFEIMEASSRAELKLDILQELERQRQMEKYQSDSAMLGRLAKAAQDLQEVQQKFGQHIRENEWLMAVKQRMMVNHARGIPRLLFLAETGCRQTQGRLAAVERIYDADFSCRASAFGNSPQQPPVCGMCGTRRKLRAQHPLQKRAVAYHRNPVAVGCAARSFCQ